MKLKLTDDGFAVVSDGKPVYVADDGKEVNFDYAATLSTISRLNGEAKTHRERAESLDTKLKAFEGIEDPAAAREAITKLRDTDFSKLIHAGKLDEVKAEAQKAFEAQLRSVEEKYKPVVAERDGLRQSLHREKIGGSFGRSKFIAEKLAIPPDLVEAKFGAAFTIEDDRVIAKDRTGNHIFSRSRPGEIADFDEALEALVDNYPYRDSNLKGSGASGSNTTGGTTGASGKKTMTRAQFDALEVMDKHKAVRDFELVD